MGNQRLKGDNQRVQRLKDTAQGVIYRERKLIGEKHKLIGEKHKLISEKHHKKSLVKKRIEHERLMREPMRHKISVLGKKVKGLEQGLQKEREENTKLAGKNAKLECGTKILFEKVNMLIDQKPYSLELRQGRKKSFKEYYDGEIRKLGL